MITLENFEILVAQEVQFSFVESFYDADHHYVHYLYLIDFGDCFWTSKLKCRTLRYRSQMSSNQSWKKQVTVESSSDFQPSLEIPELIRWESTIAIEEKGRVVEVHSGINKIKMII